MRRTSLPSIVAVFIVIFAAVPAVAATGGSIKGTVTDNTGAPIEGICVRASADSWYDNAWGTTKPDGTYRLDWLAGDAYDVRFFDCSAGEYATQYYDGVEDRRDATPVLVSDDEVVDGINATLRLLPVITGTVALADGRRAASTCVQAFTARTFAYLGSARTADDGFYRLTLSRPGPVKVRFGSCGYSWQSDDGEYADAPAVSEDATDGHASEWYEDALDFARAKVLTLAWEETVSGIDAVLEATGAISGRVTDTAGGPLGNMCVYAYGDRGGFRVVGTRTNGLYHFPSLRADTYRVRFADCWSEERHASEWYENTRFRAHATPLVIAGGTLIEGIDAEMTPLPRPDVVLDSIQVSEVPVRVGSATVADGGIERTVQVAVSNIGEAKAEYGTLAVWVRWDDGKSQRIGTRTIALRPGGTVSESFRWNTTGNLGSGTIHAAACVSRDSDTTNNVKTADTYVLVGGAGIGTRLTSSTYGACGDYYY
ncbi:MAG TPA: carboxypeptidase regulatory-like domain-containing protein [Actinomycetota bacterium]|nr:carboxypeptidase regulatory-like domain-containing protein [Actinomycetota bacterium]